MAAELSNADRSKMKISIDGDDHVLVLFDEDSRRLVIEGIGARYQMRAADVHVEPFEFMNYVGADITCRIDSQTQLRVAIARVSMLLELIRQLPFSVLLAQADLQPVADELQANASARWLRISLTPLHRESTTSGRSEYSCRHTSWPFSRRKANRMKSKCGQCRDLDGLFAAFRRVRLSQSFDRTSTLLQHHDVHSLKGQHESNTAVGRLKIQFSEMYALDTAEICSAALDLTSGNSSPVQFRSVPDSLRRIRDLGTSTATDSR